MSTIEKYTLPSFLALVSIFSPAEGMIVTVVALCLFDLLSGLLAARKQKLPITSYGLKRTIIKLLVYELAICLSYLVGTYLIGPYLPLTNIVSSVIGLTELKSILENADIIAGKPILQSVLNALQRSSSNDPSDTS